MSKAAKKKPEKKIAAAKKSAHLAKRPAARTKVAVRTTVDLQHRLDALLHTMRCIAQHEDELCTLLHDARRTGRVNATLLRDLRTLLRQLPGEEYLDDLHAVHWVVRPA